MIQAAELTQALRPSIGETLQKTPGVSATSFGPTASRPVLRGLQGERVRVLTDGIGAIDVSPDLLALIQDGAVSFTIDLQPYLQGYLSVVTLCLTITNKTPIGGAVPIANGSFIDKSNVAAVIEQVGKG